MKRLIPLMLALLLILPNIAYGADEKKKYNILVSTYFPVDEFTSAQNTMIKWFGEDQGVNVYWAETDKDCRGDVQVRNAMAILNTRRIDGVLLSSPDAKPTRVITDYCKEKGIPVIGFQEPTDSPDMLMIGVSFWYERTSVKRNRSKRKFGSFYEPTVGLNFRQKRRKSLT